MNPQVLFQDSMKTSQNQRLRKLGFFLLYPRKSMFVHKLSGVNLIKPVHLYITSVAIVLESGNNSYT